LNDTLAGVVVGMASLASLVCFILVLVEMFQRGATRMGILCIALSFCCGLGGLVGFIYGWAKAREWNIANLMTTWTVAFAIDLLAGIINPAPFRFVREMLHN
jgi:hypothetical protein